MHLPDWLGFRGKTLWDWRRILERCAELAPKVSLESASRTGTHPENPASPIPVLGGVSTTCVPASRRK